jgi:hypothetical protein
MMEVLHSGTLRNSPAAWTFQIGKSHINVLFFKCNVTLLLQWRHENSKFKIRSLISSHTIYFITKVNTLRWQELLSLVQQVLLCSNWICEDSRYEPIQQEISTYSKTIFSKRKIRKIRIGNNESNKLFTIPQSFGNRCRTSDWKVSWHCIIKLKILSSPTDALFCILVF